MDKFLKKVYDTIVEYDMIHKGCNVTVALSGGADSVCLLMALHHLRESLDVTLFAVHVNHMIRGNEADRDEDFCRELCEKYNIPFHAFHVNVPKKAELSGKSVELEARDIRYECFREQLELNGGKIATAHTLSDNGETVLLNLIRGTGLKGLCGIPPVRGDIIRPLIAVTREEIVAYLECIGQGYVTDSTNNSDDHTRNVIRHHIIPIMRELNRGFYKSLAGTLDVLRQENSFIEERVQKSMREKLCENKLVNISHEPALVRKRMVSRFLSDKGLPVSAQNINRVNSLADKDGRINIKKDLYLVGKNGDIYIETEKKPAKPLEKTLVTGENRIFEGRCVMIRESDCIVGDRKNVLDADKIIGTPLLRNRRFGDRITFAGRGHSSSVKKMLNEKVPKEKREQVHFIADREGLIFMEGDNFGIADRVKCDENTKRFWSIEVIEL